MSKQLTIKKGIEACFKCNKCLTEWTAVKTVLI